MSPRKFLGPLLAGIAIFALMIYGWITSFTKQSEGKKISKAPDAGDMCVDGTAAAETKNPNVKLFVGCGGFFE